MVGLGGGVGRGDVREVEKGGGTDVGVGKVEGEGMERGDVREVEKGGGTDVVVGL